MLVIEGCREEKTADYSDLSVEEHVKNYIDGGMSENEAIKAAAKDRGMRKNEVYAVIKRK